MLSECKTDVLAGKTLMDYCIQRYIDGTPDPATASMAKLGNRDKQAGRPIAARLRHSGYMMEYPIAQMYAAARVQKIYGGTNEIMKELIGGRSP